MMPSNRKFSSYLSVPSEVDHPIKMNSNLYATKYWKGEKKPACPHYDWVNIKPLRYLTDTKYNSFYWCSLQKTPAIFLKTSVYNLFHPYKVTRTFLPSGCKCLNGKGATGAVCSTNEVSKCASCNWGYYLSGIACALRKCSCTSGSGATGKSCPRNGTAKCASCNSGYQLSGSTCSYKRCSCSYGTAAVGSSCTAARTYISMRPGGIRKVINFSIWAGM